MTDTTQRVPVREKIGYSLGDIATNFFFQSMILYQTRFYTDTAGLAAVAVGSMFLVLRLADAVFDPIIGALSDRTQTRWGKFRPWILFTAIPFGVVFWLVYVTPNVGPQGKLIYAYFTYTLVMMLYSANNTPYSALMGVMTPDVSERSSIASYRFVGALVGQFIIQALPLPLVAKLGGGDSAKGWAITMAIFGAIIIVLNFFAFASTRERVQPLPGQKSSLKQDLNNVFRCGPWLVMFILTLLIFTMLVVRGSSSNYFFAYYLDPQQLRAFLDKLGLAGNPDSPTAWQSVLNSLGLLVKPDGSNAAAVGLSLFFVTGSLVQIIGIIFSKPLADRFGKKAVFIVGMAVTMFATLLVFVVGPTSISLMFALSILWAIGWGPTVPLLWVMIADVADYSEWKTNRRATGFMYAGILFALKAGLSLGGALSAWVIDAYGYVPNVAQSERALLGIRLGASIFPAIAMFLGLICLIIYPIGKKLTLKIQDELVERRKQYAADDAFAVSV
ncbi:MAG: MFS transporter [Blastocatellia bacterium]|nr:MAG: MFS transporter [Blastocatellia bacterium]